MPAYHVEAGVYEGRVRHLQPVARLARDTAEAAHQRAGYALRRILAHDLDNAEDRISQVIGDLDYLRKALNELHGHLTSLPAEAQERARQVEVSA